MQIRNIILYKKKNICPIKRDEREATKWDRAAGFKCREKEMNSQNFYIVLCKYILSIMFYMKYFFHGIAYEEDSRFGETFGAEEHAYYKVCSLQIQPMLKCHAMHFVRFKRQI